MTNSKAAKKGKSNKVAKNATQVRRAQTDARVLEQRIGNLKDGEKLGEKTDAVRPDEVEIFFLSKTYINFEKFSKTCTLIQGAYERDYPEFEQSSSSLMNEFNVDVKKAKATLKKNLSKAVSKHPLSARLSKIKGFTDYQLGLIMSFMKTPERFRHMGALCVYAGVTEVCGLKLNLKNLNRIRQIKQNPEFGYHTEFQQRMYILAECLFRSNGWFTQHAQSLRRRLGERAVNEGRAVWLNKEQLKDLKWKDREEGYYMRERDVLEGWVLRKNQSLKQWTMTNASWRISKILLCLLYEEWNTILNIPTRDPYALEYLGHTTKITLDEILQYEANQKAAKLAAKKAKKDSKKD